MNNVHTYLILCSALFLKSRKSKISKTLAPQHKVQYTTKPSAVTVASSKPSNQKQPNKTSGNTVYNQSSRPRSTSTAQARPRPTTTTQQVKPIGTTSIDANKKPKEIQCNYETMTAIAASEIPKEMPHTDYEAMTSSFDDVDTYEGLYS